MPFPRRLLNDNENMVLDLHPHWWFFGPSAVSLAGWYITAVAVPVVVFGILWSGLYDFAQMAGTFAS